MSRFAKADFLRATQCPTLNLAMSLTFIQDCKLKFQLRVHISVSVALRPAPRPLKKTAGATAEHEQEVCSLNLNLSLQACFYITTSEFPCLECLHRL